MALLGYLLAAGSGLSLGLIGGGGSTLTVPILVYVFHFPAKDAIAMSLAVVGVTSLVGAVSHWREGHVSLRTAGLFGGVAMLGTYLGARLSVFFSGSTQLVLFAGVMLVSSGFMFRDAFPADPPQGPRQGKLSSPVFIGVEGLLVGILTGLVGVGGGFLIVPALVLLGGLPMKDAIGTSLLIIALKSAAGVAGYMGQVEMPWRFLGAFTASAIGGILVGSRWVRHFGQKSLKQGFSVFLLVMGSFVLYQNRSVLWPGP